LLRIPEVRELQFADREDIGQLVMLALWRAEITEPFQFDAQVQAWIRSVALNRVRDLRKMRGRYRKRVQTVDMSDDSDNAPCVRPSNVQQQNDATRLNGYRAFDMLNRLADGQRAIIEATVLRNLSSFEAAAELGKTAAAVRVAKTRAIKNLRRIAEVGPC